MHGKNEAFFRFLETKIDQAIRRQNSVLLLGPRQTGKTWLLEKILGTHKTVLSIPFQDPSVRQEYERDPALLGRRIDAIAGHVTVFIDEAQKVASIFDAVQSPIDRKKATVVLSGSSARKLRRGGANLLPGRILSYRLDPCTWGELGLTTDNTIRSLTQPCSARNTGYSFEKTLIFGTLPGIAAIPGDAERAEFLRSYTQLYLEEEVRSEALTRNIGAFSRFLELAAAESGSAPNFNKLSMESGVSAPTIKEYYSVLQDTLIAEPVPPYLKNARKRVLQTPRYYFFDNGVRNALARFPLSPGLAAATKGSLFEHAVMLEIIRRCRALGNDYRVCFWRTSNGLEVDCVVDCGDTVIPIEIKSSRRVALADLRGLRTFLDDYPKIAPHGYVVTMGGLAERLAPNITAVPWNML